MYYRYRVSLGLCFVFNSGFLLFCLPIICTFLIDERSPETAAGMYHPVPGRLLPNPLLHQCLFRAEELHCELVVCRLEECLQLVPKET